MSVLSLAVSDHADESLSQLQGIHFAVNDVYIDDRACDPQLYDKHVDPRVFFGDNLGFFSVQLQVK